MKSDTAIVRELAERIRKAMRRGPSAMRLPGRAAPQPPFGRGGVGMGHNTFTFHSVVPALDLHWWDTGSKAAAKRIFRRAMKKAGQPHRKNHRRHQMRRKASGKNEVRQ